MSPKSNEMVVARGRVMPLPDEPEHHLTSVAPDMNAHKRWAAGLPPDWAMTPQEAEKRARGRIGVPSFRKRRSNG
jgi:hypothetical protein